MKAYRNLWASIVFIFVFCLLRFHAAEAQDLDRPSLESVVVRTDKVFYIPGEIIWFKLYSMGSDLSSPPSPRSRIAYVELLDEKKSPVFQAKVDLESTLSDGSFYIPPTVESGFYYLVGYTNLSKKDSLNQLYYRKIKIANPYRARSEVIDTAVQDRGHAPDWETANAGVRAVADQGGLDIRSSFDVERTRKRQNVEFSLTSYLDGEVVDADLAVSIYAVNELQKAPAQISFSDRTPRSNVETTDPVPYDSSNPHPITNTSTLELFFHQIRIQYHEKSSNQPIVGQEAFLTLIDRYPKLYVATTDSSGIATFFVNPFYGEMDMATQIAGGRPSDIQVLSPFMENHDFPGVGYTGSDTLDPASKDQLLHRHSLNVQLENLFYNEGGGEFYRLARDTVSFYGIADKVYFLDDYTRFVLMEEVFREYVTEVNIRRSRGDYSFRVFDEARGFYQSGVPLLVLDGVPISNANDLIAYDPLKVERVEIMTSKFIFGRTIYDGVVNFYTYDGDLKDFTLHAGVTLFNYEGLQQKRNFFYPAYENEEQRNSRFPDRRNVLLWKPTLVFDKSQTATVKFTTSDVPGDYVVVVEGLDKQGNVGSMVKYFTVE